MVEMRVNIGMVIIILCVKINKVVVQVNDFEPSNDGLM